MVADQELDKAQSATWLALRDAAYVDRLMPVLRLAVKLYFRSEVRGLEHLPEAGALMVSNHSGGLVAMDVPVVAVAFHDYFGGERPFYILAHDLLLRGGGKNVLGRAGFLPASRENAIAALRSGAVTLVFPGGDYDVFRPSVKANKIDFAGRKGYIRTAMDAGVPIVPVVSIGGQEEYLFLSRGEWLARLLRLDKLLRLRIAPIIVGLPFGVTSGYMPNLPMPTKIVTQVLEPVRVQDDFGENPDIDHVDDVVRGRMQAALDALARERRFPVIG